MLPNTINIWAAGQLNSPILMDVVGLGIGVTSSIGMAIFLGLNGALYTFLSQAIGAENHRKAGVYRQRGRFVITIAFIILIPFYIFSGKLLKLCGQNEIVAEKSGFFILIYIPAIYIMALIDIDKILLTNLDKTNHAMGCQILTPIIHLLWVWLFALHLKMGTSGIALAYFLTNSIIWILQCVIILKLEIAAEVNTASFFSKETYQDMKEYMKIAGPSVISFLVEFASFDIQIILMGMVGVLSQASMVIFININV